MRRLVVLFLVIAFACGAIMTLSAIPSLFESIFTMAAAPSQEITASLEQIARTGTTGQAVMAVLILPFVLLAGLSEVLGQFYILFANRVRPLRFALTLGLNIVIFLFSYALTVTAVYVAGLIFHGRGTLLIVSMLAVAASYQPLMLGFLSVLPYFGSHIMRVLYLIAYLLLAEGLFALGFTPLEAFFTAVVSLIIVYVLRATIGRPIIWLAGKARNVTAGTRIGKSIDEALTYRGDFLVSRKD